MTILSQADLALLDRADRYLANSGGERERRRLDRAIGDLLAWLSPGKECGFAPV
jgi:hypothetical protein